MASDEEFVREHWERVHTGAAALHLSDYCASIVVNAEEFPDWSAAAAFTRERLEQIRQVEEECGLLESLAPVIHRDDLHMWAGIDADPDDATIDDCETIAIDNSKFQCRVQRILAREQAILAELKRGMK